MMISSARVMPSAITMVGCAVRKTSHKPDFGGYMNIKLAALTALLLGPGQAMAEDIRVVCLTDQRIICRDDETTCRPPVREPGTYHFTLDLTKKTGSLVFCSYGSGEKPSPLTVVHDNCAFLFDFGAGCVSGGISMWEQDQQETYTISNSRYVMTHSFAGTDHSLPDYSLSVTQFGRCAIQ
jgi:hypothetical protein